MFAVAFRGAWRGGSSPIVHSDEDHTMRATSERAAAAHRFSCAATPPATAACGVNSQREQREGRRQDHTMTM
jgi:hypothetical protein